MKRSNRAGQALTSAAAMLSGGIASADSIRPTAVGHIYNDIHGATTSDSAFLINPGTGVLEFDLDGLCGVSRAVLEIGPASISQGSSNCFTAFVADGTAYAGDGELGTNDAGPF